MKLSIMMQLLLCLQIFLCNAADSDPALLNQVHVLKKRNPQLQVLLKVVVTQTNRSYLVTAAIAYAHQHGFDGIEVDVEYPDLHDITSLLDEFCTAAQAAHPPLLVAYGLSSPEVLPKYLDSSDFYLEEDWFSENDWEFVGQYVKYGLE